jgi:hypothetical protein
MKRAHDKSLHNIKGSVTDKNDYHLSPTPFMTLCE